MREKCFAVSCLPFLSLLVRRRKLFGFSTARLIFHFTKFTRSRGVHTAQQPIRERKSRAEAERRSRSRSRCMPSGWRTLSTQKPPNGSDSERGARAGARLKVSATVKNDLARFWAVEQRARPGKTDKVQKQLASRRRRRPSERKLN